MPRSLFDSLLLLAFAIYAITKWDLQLLALAWILFEIVNLKARPCR